VDQRTDKVGFQIDWTHYYLTPELARVLQTGLMTGAAATQMAAVAVWHMQGITRWVLEQPNGGWRYVPSRLTIGSSSGTDINSAATWTLERGRTDNHPGAPPTVRGTWMSSADQNECPLTYEEYVSNATGVAYYPGYYLSCLVAAVDYGLPNALEAFQTVMDGITNIEQWRGGFGTDPRWGQFPRSYSQAAFTALGTGSDAGTFNADVLTPGRDERGRMNAASWALVPTGRWIRVAGTDIQQFDAVVKARIPGWRVYGTEAGWGATMNNFNGMAHHDATARYWLMNAGGHSGGSNNGIYGFDAIRMAWWIERMPSDTNKWSLQYRNRTAPQPDTYTFCYESDQSRQFEIAAGTATPRTFWYDEIQWDNPHVPGGNTDESGVPTSEHTYSACIFNPLTNELIKCGRGQRLWRYNRNTGKYTYKRIINDGVGSFSGAGGILMFNEATQTFIRSAAADGIYTDIGYNLTTNQWFAASTPWRIFWPPADTRWGNKVTVIVHPQADSPGVGGTFGRYWVYDVPSGTTDTTGVFQLAPGLNRTDFVGAGSYYDGAGLVYVPPLNRYWLCTRGTVGIDGMRWFEIDPTTTPWTISRLVFAAGVTPTPQLQLHKKMFWVPVLNAVMLVDRHDANLQFYKF
jgi:hypothetical protein